jgi:predicted PurR-regulated permease PerM
MNASEQNSPVRQAIEIAVHLSLIFLVIAWCFQILRPFISLLAWGAIIAVSIYTPFLKLRKALGGRNKWAVTLIAVIGVAIVMVPSWMFAESLIGSAQTFYSNANSDSFELKPPSDSVREWPVIGPRLYETWSEASSNIQGFLEKNSDQVKDIARTLLSKAAGIGLGVLLFVASILVAAAFLANAEGLGAGALRLCRRVAGEEGDEMLELTVATIRSVTVGVLGIAAIQAFLGGVGMYAVGVPATGVWTLAILILAIAQLPPWIILGPIIVYVFSYETTTVAVIFMIWSLAVSFADMVLKPLLLGRGVNVPMLAILLGAIGGMLMAGVMGLFVGAVILALGYKLFVSWLDMDKQEDADDESTEPEPEHSPYTQSE